MSSRFSRPVTARFSQTLLLVEDDDICQATMPAVLSRLGFTVLTAASGREALSVLASRDVDLVLMDIQMPEMDGVEATRRIRSGEAGERMRNVPIVALTAYALAGDEEAFLAAGMTDYLAKPMALADLVAVLRRVLPDACGR